MTAGEDLEAQGRTSRRPGAELGGRDGGDDLEGRLHGPCGEDAEVRGGGAGTTWSGRRGQPGCAKRAAREDGEARGGGGRGGVVGGRWGQPGGRDGGG